MDPILASIFKHPEVKGRYVYVTNGAGCLVHTYSRLELAKAYFSMSNDAFFNTYGFNLVPTGDYYDAGKKLAGKA